MIENRTHVFFLFRDDYLSNFYASEYHLYGKRFTCVEQGYQYEKAMRFNDIETANEILLVRSPYEHKRLGSQVKGFDEKEWEKHRVYAMMIHIEAKFTQNPDLKALLLLTGNRVIVEASNKDQFWGCGIRITDPLVFDENNWTGRNALGIVIHRIRETIRNRGMILGN